MMDCMCCSSDDRWVEAKFDLMVERLRSWIDDVEYKIKDAIENRKKQQEAEKLAKSAVSTPDPAISQKKLSPDITSPTENPISTPWSDREFLDPPSPDLSDKQFVFLTPADSDSESDTFPTPPPPVGSTEPVDLDQVQPSLDTDSSQPGELEKSKVEPCLDTTKPDVGEFVPPVVCSEPSKIVTPESSVVIEPGKSVSSTDTHRTEPSNSELENIISTASTDSSIEPLCHKEKTIEEPEETVISTKTDTLSEPTSHLSEDSKKNPRPTEPHSEQILSTNVCSLAVANSGRSKDLLEKSNEIEKLLSTSQVSPTQNDLSRDVNMNSDNDKQNLKQESDKSDEIRNLSSSSNSDRHSAEGTLNISDPNVVESGTGTGRTDATAAEKSGSGKAEKVLNRSIFERSNYRTPAIYKRSLSASYITLLKTMPESPTSLPTTIEEQTSSTEHSTQNILENCSEKIQQTQKSTQNILESLSYVSTENSSESGSVRNRRNPERLSLKRSSSLLKADSIDQSEDELIRQMGSTIGLTRGSQNHTEEKSAGLRREEIDNPFQSGECGTEHQLLDHSFSQDTPSDLTPNFAANLIRRLRRNTSDFLVRLFSVSMSRDYGHEDNHDAENDPSLSLETLNDRAREGLPVIPTIKCDIAIRVSSKTSEEVLTWLKEQLVFARLIVSSEIGCSGDIFLKVTADSRIFLKGAETMELLKRIHPDRGDGMKPFNRNEVTMFCARQSTDGFLSAAERQLILYDIVTRIRTEAPVSVGGVKFHQHESIVSGLVSNNVIKQIYPLHQKSKQNVLNRLWVWNLFGTQPLNLIRHYFGDEIAIYFAWLGSYTSILVVPLIVGFSIGLFYDDDNVNSADWCFTFYAFFNVVWPTLFLEIWKRRSAALAWEWGTLGRDIERQEIQRPQFYGTLGDNPVTGEVELQYSSIKRQIKQTVSLFVSVVCLIVVLVSMLAVFRFDDYIQETCEKNTFPDFLPSFLRRFVRYTPKILLPITVGILDVLYSNLAVTLNDWENYKHQRTYENWLVLKLILFKFVNSFLALFYTAFYLQDFDKLQETLAALLITKQIVGNFSEILGPTLISWVKVYLLKRNNSMSQDSKSNEKLSQVETESEKPRYESSFDDYLEMFIQMGYVILFSAAYPPAAVWAFLNNVVEIRGDAFKLVNGLQKPFIKRVEDIGFWQDAFEVLSVISIVVNCSLIGIRGQVGRWFPDFNTGQQILFVIFMEHIFLSIKFIIDRAIPDVPGWVQLASAKERYTRNRALKGLEKLMQTARLKGQVRKKVDAVRSRLIGKRAGTVVEEEVQRGEEGVQRGEEGVQEGSESASARCKLE